MKTFNNLEELCCFLSELYSSYTKYYHNLNTIMYTTKSRNGDFAYISFRTSNSCLKTFTMDISVYHKLVPISKLKNNHYLLPTLTQLLLINRSNKLQKI